MPDPSPTDEPDLAGLGYADALAELDRILATLEEDDLDVDVLGARVRRAAALLRLCRSRIATARAEVTSVVDELAAGTDAADAD